MVVKKSVLIKDMIRDIRKSIGRFISIVAIITLGVAFFSGVKVSPKVMEYTADRYYDDYNLMDIRILSTLGLTDDDLKEISKIEGIKESIGTYVIDTLAEYDEKEVVIRLHGIDSFNKINDVKLIKGRLPEKIDECVIEAGKDNSTRVPIGSKVKLFSGKEEELSETLENTEFIVVGAVQTPYYLSFEKGSSNIGNGQVRDFIMIPKENFKLDVYTDILLTVEDAKDLNSYDKEYFDIVNPVTDKIKDLAKIREKIRYEEILIDAQEELEEGKREYFHEKADANKKLEEALEELKDAKKEIDNGEKQLKANELKFKLSIKEGKEKVEQAEKELLKGEEEYEKGLETFNENKILAEKGFLQAENEIKKGEESISLLEKQISQINNNLENPLITQEEKEKLLVELQTAKGTLQGVKAAVENGRTELARNKEKVLNAEKELKKTKELLNSSKKRIETEKLSLKKGEEEGILEIAKVREKLERGKKDLIEAEKEYNDSKEKAEKEFEDAWKKIQEGENDLKKIEKAKWYVLDRKSHYSYVDYGGAADRINAISQVFPVFFALVAALVCLTTMTRMVDEQRTNIGTLKALGYNKSDIAFKYIFYALTATILGCIIGILIGYTLFPTIIFNAYGIMYILPPVILKFNVALAAFISLGAIGLTTMTTFISCNNELKDNPSSLMRPKAPRLGKRILLEKIPFIWNRFNFSYKVSIRNIFRYKRRFFMTIFGIAGCTALMLTAFGIKDSIKTVVNRQFGNLFTYDVTIGLEDNGEKHLEENKSIIDYELISMESGTIILDTMEKDISITTPKDRININKFIHLQNRKGGKELTIEEKGVVITEQISRSLNVSVGDEITLINKEKDEAKVKVTGITENYTFNYVYISPEYYEEIFKIPVEFNQAIGILSDTSKEFEYELSRELIKKEGISSISFNTSIRDNFEDTIRSLNYVVIVMIISAGALAFVVLYNLTNVNISERIREIATIKVLGFYDNEVSVYIYRENTILTIMGALTGLVMGIFLHRFIMTTVEMENIMFGLKLEWKSYIFSISLTLIFAILVNFAMYYKLKKVEMVESLKSVD